MGGDRDEKPWLAFWVSNSWSWLTGLWRFIILLSLILCMFEISRNKNKWKRRKTILTRLVMEKILLCLKINLGNRTRGFLEETGKGLTLIKHLQVPGPVLGIAPEIIWLQSSQQVTAVVYPMLHIFTALIREPGG